MEVADGETIELCILPVPAVHIEAARMLKGGDFVDELELKDQYRLPV